MLFWPCLSLILAILLIGSWWAMLYLTSRDIERAKRNYYNHRSGTVRRCGPP